MVAPGFTVPPVNHLDSASVAQEGTSNGVAHRNRHLAAGPDPDPLGASSLCASSGGPGCFRQRPVPDRSWCRVAEHCGAQMIARAFDPKSR